MGCKVWGSNSWLMTSVDNELPENEIKDQRDLLLARLTLVGVDILIKKFGFSVKQAALWLNETLNEIDKNAIHVEKSSKV